MACRMLSFLLIPAEACTHHEQLKEHQGKSEPLFLVYRVSTQIGNLGKACMPYQSGRLLAVCMNNQSMSQTRAASHA